LVIKITGYAAIAVIDREPQNWGAGSPPLWDGGVAGPINMSPHVCYHDKIVSSGVIG